MTPRLATHSGLTAEEILYVLNGRQTVPLFQLSLVVITGTYTPHRLEPADWPFTPGEIFPVQHFANSTPEFLGAGRNPYEPWEDSNWCIHQEDNLEAALEVAALVASDRPRGYYEWGDDGLSYYTDQRLGEQNWCSWQDGSVVRIGDFTGRGFHAESAERRDAEA